MRRTLGIAVAAAVAFALAACGAASGTSGAGTDAPAARSTAAERPAPASPRATASPSAAPERTPPPPPSYLRIACADYDIVGQAAQLGYSIEGAQSYYRLRVDWGDASQPTEVPMDALAGDPLTHEYINPGLYFVTATLLGGDVRATCVAVVLNDSWTAHDPTMAHNEAVLVRLRYLTYSSGGSMGGSSGGGSSSSSGGGGTIGLCADGTITHSKGKQGACSYHGGLG